MRCERHCDARVPYMPRKLRQDGGRGAIPAARRGELGHAGVHAQALMPILSLTLPFVWGSGIVGPVATAAVFPPGVQDVGVAVELLLAVAFVHLVVRAA